MNTPFTCTFPTVEAALSALGQKVLGVSIAIEPEPVNGPDTEPAAPDDKATIAALTVACEILAKSNESLRDKYTSLKTTNASLFAQRDKLHEELETERMRLAAVGVVALADTPDSAKEARVMLPEYHSASLGDVIRRVDECIELRTQVASLRQDVTRLNHENLKLRVTQAGADLIEYKMYKGVVKPCPLMSKGITLMQWLEQESTKPNTP